jgi:hypothetical protein
VPLGHEAGVRGPKAATGLRLAGLVLPGIRAGSPLSRGVSRGSCFPLVVSVRDAALSSVMTAGTGLTDRLLGEIRRARARLPAEHRNLLEQIGAQEAAKDDWPHGVQDLYRSVQEKPPTDAALAGAAAVWLDGLRAVVFNAPLLHETTFGLSDAAREELIAYIAWHEYRHALSLTRSTREQREDGERLFSLLPSGMRGSIDYPSGYSRLEVFDEVIATVYAVMISRVRTDGYGVPKFLHHDVFHAFAEVIPWPPTH